MLAYKNAIVVYFLTITNVCKLTQVKRMTLFEWIKYKGFTIAQMERELCISRQCYYAWKKGKVKPTSFSKKRIEKLTKGKVTLNDWA